MNSNGFGRPEKASLVFRLGVVQGHGQLRDAEWYSDVSQVGNPQGRSLCEDPGSWHFAEHDSATLQIMNLRYARPLLASASLGIPMLAEEIAWQWTAECNPRPVASEDIVRLCGAAFE